MKLLALAVAVAATPTPTPVQTQGSNVTVTTCHAQLDPPPLRIAYVNTAHSEAVEVDFTVIDSAGTVESVSDRGRFGSGTSINHVFKLPAGTSPLGLSAANCIVTKVIYADGSTWVNPNPP